MQLRILTPERTVLESNEVEHVLLPAEDGELGILPGHISMVASLTVGRMLIDLPDQTLLLATSGGFAEVLADNVLVLADTAELAAEIDVERAAAARQRAEDRLARRGERLDTARARAALARSVNRISVADML
jgi:F-type H+-transporting ATPase subunit epsilon